MAKFELKENKVASIVISGESSSVVLPNGKDVTMDVKPGTLQTAVGKGDSIMFVNESGVWKRQGYLSLKEVEEVKAFMMGFKAPKVEATVEVEPELMAFKTFVHDSVKLRPELLKMDDLKWKYLVRSVMRGKNIMMTGPAGSGKTFAVQQLTKALNEGAKKVTKQVTKSELEQLKKNMKVELHSYSKVQVS